MNCLAMLCSRRGSSTRSLVSICALLVLSSFCLGPEARSQGSGWVGHWRLDETSGTTARDLSPGKNDGALKNFGAQPWVAGRIGNALQFDGIDDYVEVQRNRGLPVYRGLGEPYAVTMWVKGLPQEDRRCYSEGHTQSGSAFRALFTVGTGRGADMTQDRLQIFIRNEAGRDIINWRSDAVVFDDKWHHVAWIDVAGDAKLYIDGVLDTRNWDYRSVIGSPQSASYGSFRTDRVSLGAVLRASTCCHFKGSIDDVRVFRSALNAIDVKTIMLGAGPPPCAASIGKFGYGCGVGPLDILGSGTGQLGKSVDLRVTNGAASAPVWLLLGLENQPLTLTGPFAGCRLYPGLAALGIYNIGTLDANGASTLAQIPIPNNPSIACGLAVFQGLSFRANRFEFSGAILTQFGR